jgi:hypothetical protein
MRTLSFLAAPQEKILPPQVLASLVSLASLPKFPAKIFRPKQVRVRLTSMTDPVVKESESIMSLLRALDQKTGDLLVQHRETARRLTDIERKTQEFLYFREKFELVLEEARGRTWKTSRIPRVVRECLLQDRGPGPRCTSPQGCGERCRQTLRVTQVLKTPRGSDAPSRSAGTPQSQKLPMTPHATASSWWTSQRG